MTKKELKDKLEETVKYCKTHNFTPKEIVSILEKCLEEVKSISIPEEEKKVLERFQSELISARNIIGYAKINRYQAIDYLEELVTDPYFSNIE